MNFEKPSTIETSRTEMPDQQDTAKEGLQIAEAQANETAAFLDKAQEAMSTEGIEDLSTEGPFMDTTGDIIVAFQE